MNSKTLRSASIILFNKKKEVVYRYDPSGIFAIEASEETWVLMAPEIWEPYKIFQK